MLELKDFEAAADRLKNVIHNIPLSTSCTFSAMTGAEVYLKYENQQKTGSFKVRGAYNKIMKRFAEGDLHAVVASSAGNHAQGVAFAATAAGVKSTIVMPRSAPIAKVSATQGYGAEVVLAGNIYDEAYAKACEICEETGAEFIHPFDDEDVMAGQGTIALEILRDLPGVDMIFVPAGGGGLISGVAACAKQINPRIQIIGVQAEGAPAIANSFRTGERTPSDTVHTIADGIAVKTPGEKTFEYIKQYVDRVVTVSDDGCTQQQGGCKGQKGRMRAVRRQYRRILYSQDCGKGPDYPLPSAEVLCAHAGCTGRTRAFLAHRCTAEC